MDTGKEPSISIHKTNGKEMIFREHPNGLYYFNTMSAPETSQTSLLQSVNENTKFFTTQEIDAANTTQDLYQKLVAHPRPSMRKS
jgi:hypothetical protein